MSHVLAYGCDICGLIKPDVRVMGVNPIEDLFESLKSFPTVYNPKKVHVHYCLDCYNEQVTVPAENTAPRKRNEDSHRAAVTDLAALLRKTAVLNYQEKKFFKHLDL